jgi:hypothetical protein
MGRVENPPLSPVRRPLNSSPLKGEDKGGGVPLPLIPSRQGRGKSLSDGLFGGDFETSGLNFVHRSNFEFGTDLIDFTIELFYQFI